jgi:hypothetical protein
MVFKSFIAYACLFGFTTSINAQALGPSGFTSSPSLAHSHHSADNDRPIFKRLKVLPGHGIAAPPPGPFDYLNVVGYRDLDSVHKPALAVSE